MSETRFGLQFVVTRDGEPITDVITVENMPINLHSRHERLIVWPHQVSVLTELVKKEIEWIDPLRDVVPDSRPVGLAPREDAGYVRETFGTPILKAINRVLLALNRRLAEYNRKRGRNG